MFCHNCGKRISKNATFCPYCGAHQLIKSTPKLRHPQMNSSYRQNQQKPVQPHHHHWLGAIILALICVVALAFLGFHHYQEQKQVAQSQSSRLQRPAKHSQHKAQPKVRFQSNHHKGNVRPYSTSHRSYLVKEPDYEVWKASQDIFEDPHKPDYRIHPVLDYGEYDSMKHLAGIYKVNISRNFVNGTQDHNYLHYKAVINSLRKRLSQAKKSGKDSLSYVIDEDDLKMHSLSIHGNQASVSYVAELEVRADKTNSAHHDDGSLHVTVEYPVQVKEVKKNGHWQIVAMKIKKYAFHDGML